MPENSQPKFIVFHGMLINIFTLFCFKYKEKAPTVSMKCHGTKVTVTQHCLKCKDVFEWNFQPLVMGKYPTENVLLSLAIFVADALMSKVLLIFHHGCFSLFCKELLQTSTPVYLSYYNSFLGVLLSYTCRQTEEVETGCLDWQCKVWVILPNTTPMPYCAQQSWKLCILK